MSVALLTSVHRCYSFRGAVVACSCCGSARILASIPSTLHSRAQSLVLMRPACMDQKVTRDEGRLRRERSRRSVPCSVYVKDHLSTAVYCVTPVGTEYFSFLAAKSQLQHLDAATVGFALRRSQLPNVNSFAHVNSRPPAASRE